MEIIIAIVILIIIVLLFTPDTKTDKNITDIMADITIGKPGKKEVIEEEVLGFLSPREYVIEREQGKCKICGSKGHHIHHIKPKSEGGSDHPSNLVLLCAGCHAQKHIRNEKFVRSSSDEYSRKKRARKVGNITLQRREARKKYTCEICWEYITPGQEYFYGRSGYYGDPMSDYPTSSSSIHVCYKCAVKYNLAVN